MKKRLTREQGLLHLKEYNTPEHVIRHCIAVADTAEKMAEALNAAGKNLDLAMIEGAAIIHDIARVEEHHELVGCEYAKSIGLPEEAEIIRQHMRYPKFNDIANVNETDIVCLSDRVVLEDRYAGIDKRIEYIIGKARNAGADDDIIQGIIKKREETKTFIHQIEEYTGKAFDEICS